MTVQANPPKSISDQIFETFFDTLNESDLFDLQAIEQLKKLHKNKALTKGSSGNEIENIINSVGVDQ